jgi:hypothetical protein
MITLNKTGSADGSSVLQRVCSHQPACPSAEAPDREAAHLLASHPEQGWTLLCNGVVVFEDTGELLPDGRVIAPHRPLPQRRVPPTAA